ncbi:hypothetical protein OIC43_37115 [Streptomyces sp. NBC_00825]|uniref:hypothetical protein n=1 Tax=unclassified Streptomyces TaxID=2593676 RepID=UPI002ED0E9ED|nr:hypothetical protein OG832_06575 [Streptomyces sp. NBC_00826]WTH94258.1 hypothetical protein OIC43_37115 [Streptomyces sp. NBC_00825]WTI02993.1 hypothetical protein OHA23_37095 [Streptomyces sp. NBC_00822]
MPIYLREPEPVPGGPDGKGWNRLSLGAHFGTGGGQCALRPRSWGALVEAQDTRRARWGGHGPCIRRGQCDGCLVLEALHTRCTVVSVNAPQVLVRIEPVFTPGLMLTGPAGYRLWVTTGPEDRDYRTGQPWTWDDAVRVPGWDLGGMYYDEHGDGFWLKRTTRVPALGCTIVTRARRTFTRHAFGVARTWIARLHCPGGNACAHGPELLNAISHACPGPEGADEERVPVHRRQAQELTPRPLGALRFGADVQNMHVKIVAIDGPKHERARLTLTGSGWTADRVRAAGEALRAHLADR